MTKRSAQGTTFQVGDGADPEVFTEIPGTSSINWPGNPTPDIDVTDLVSTGRETIAGLPDQGEMTLEIIWDFSGETLHKQLYDDYKAGTARNYQRVDPDGTIREAEMYPRQVGEPREVDNAIRATVTMRISGDDTYTVAP